MTGLDEGRDAYGGRRWREACLAFEAADRDQPLEVDDLERLAEARFLVGDHDGSVETWTRAHQEALRVDDAARAARCAFWLGFSLDITGVSAPAAGWFERARRLVAELPSPCVEQGYVLVPAALATLMVEGDPGGAVRRFDEMLEIGRRHDDPDLVTMGRLGRGHALVLLGERAEGLAVLDEVMVAVTADEVSPALAGLSYCAVIDVCNEVFDVRRAREWTKALTAWCEAQPDLVPFRGNCLVHRAEVLQLDGAWDDALAEAERAVDLLADAPDQSMVGAACYRRGELHRLRGELAAAEEDYRRASHWGHVPQPGLALLRLAQGRAERALATIRRAVDETSLPLARARLLPAAVEISLAAGDTDAARSATEELTRIAADEDAPVLRAAALEETGTVGCADDEPAAALPALREAQATWRRVGARYEAARTGLALAAACRALGDTDGATMQHDAAMATFHDLGAACPTIDLREPDPASGGGRLAAEADDEAGLSPRERDVLALVATGRTNREVAGALHISERTVAHHVSSIFAKVGVTSRAAATAYAYEHDLVAGRSAG